jgi:hypothetical protein
MYILPLKKIRREDFAKSRPAWAKNKTKQKSLRMFHVFKKICISKNMYFLFVYSYVKKYF